MLHIGKTSISPARLTAALRGLKWASLGRRRRRRSQSDELERLQKIDINLSQEFLEVETNSGREVRPPRQIPDTSFSTPLRIFANTELDEERLRSANFPIQTNTSTAPPPALSLRQRRLRQSAASSVRQHKWYHTRPITNASSFNLFFSLGSDWFIRLRLAADWPVIFRTVYKALPSSLSL